MPDVPEPELSDKNNVRSNRTPPPPERTCWCIESKRNRRIDVMSELVYCVIRLFCIIVCALSCILLFILHSCVLN